MPNKGKVEFIEVKGKETALWKVKYKLAKVWMDNNFPDATMILVKKVKGRFTEVERYNKK